MTLRRILLSLAVLLTVGAVASPVLAAAADGRSSTVDGFVRGALTMSSSRQGAILSADGMTIGAEASGSARIANTGDVAGAYILSAAVEGSPVLARHLRLTVYRVRGGAPHAKLYEGALSDLRSVRLGTFAKAGEPGSANTFSFHVSFPTTGTSAGDNALQGLAASALFTWTATQA